MGDAKYAIELPDISNTPFHLVEMNERSGACSICEKQWSEEMKLAWRNNPSEESEPDWICLKCFPTGFAEVNEYRQVFADKAEYPIFDSNDEARAFSIIDVTKDVFSYRDKERFGALNTMLKPWQLQKHQVPLTLRDLDIDISLLRELKNPNLIPIQGTDLVAKVMLIDKNLSIYLTQNTQNS